MLILGAIVQAAPASAQFCDDCQAWTSRIAVGWIQPGPNARTGIDRVAPGALSVDPGVLLLIDVGRRIARQFEVQVGGGLLSLPASLTSQAVDAGSAERLSGFSVSDVHVGVLYHPFEMDAADFYVGPLIAGMTRDAATNPSGSRSVSEPGGLGFGAQAGVRIPLCRCSRVALDASIRWNRWRLPVESGGSLAIDPWLFAFGVAVRH
jgi:hypothetical protein